MQRNSVKLFAAVLLIFLVATLAVSGCAAPAPAPKPTPAPTLTLDIGVASALSGFAADLGADLTTGALQAIEDQNKEGGVTIAGQKYTLNPIQRDTKMDLVAARSIAEELVFDKKVKIIFAPAIIDAIGMQPVTEANKVINICLQVIIPAMCSPDKPYTFFSAGPLLQFYNITVGYIATFYPQAKTMVSTMPDLADTPSFVGPAQKMCQQYGLTWLRSEFFPISTKDFSPMISKLLAGNPDIIDTGSTGGSAGALVCVLIKQLREAGYKGIIMVPASPVIPTFTEIVPQRYLTGIVDYNLDANSTKLPSSYQDLRKRYMEKCPQCMFFAGLKHYNTTKAFLQFLNGQATMDTTAWAQGFAEYRWKNVWGLDSFFCGEPIWGINRQTFDSTYCCEFKDGKLDMKLVPIKMELYVTPK